MWFFLVCNTYTSQFLLCRRYKDGGRFVSRNGPTNFYRDTTGPRVGRRRVWSPLEIGRKRERMHKEWKHILGIVILQIKILVRYIQKKVNMKKSELQNTLYRNSETHRQRLSG